MALIVLLPAMLILQVHKVCCVAMEGTMELRSVHPAETKEITPLSAWLITRAVIGVVFIFTFAPFVIYYFQH